MAIHRIVAQWTGFPGAPGYTNFHFMAGGGLISDAQSSADKVLDFFNQFKTYLPPQTRIEIQPEVAVIDEDTGVASNFVLIDPGERLAGTGTGSYAGPAGAVINWRTNDLRFGRRIRGRTFLVPLTSAAFEGDGTLASNARNFIQGAADSLVGGDLDSEFVVWSRPRNGSGGVAATVTQANVPDMAAVLRSRRD